MTAGSYSGEETVGAPQREPTVVFSPGAEPVTVPLEELVGDELSPAHRVDRGSRAETVTYGGGLRPTSRRIAAASALALAIAAALGTIIYLVNAESANRYVAAVVPANVVELDFADSGLLGSILVSRGERVHVGQVLAFQQNSDLRVALDEAKLVVAADAARLAGLIAETRSTPSTGLSQQVLAGRAALAEARLQLAIDRADLEQTILRSPISGTVLRTAGVPGELVGQDGVHNSALTDPSLPQSSIARLFPSAAGQNSNSASGSVPVVSLVAGRRWQVIAAVPESVVTTIRPGERASFQFDSLGGLSVPAVVRGVIGVPFERAGQINYEVVLRLKRRLPPGVLPGMSGNISLG